MADPDYKTCRRCGESFPKTREFFHKAGAYLQSYCKPCAKTNGQEWIAANRERAAARRRTYALTHRDRLAEKARQYVAAHRAEISAKKLERQRQNPNRKAVALAWYYRNRETVSNKAKSRYTDPAKRARVLADQAAYRKAHPDRRKEARAKWAAKNQVRRAGYSAHRRALKSGTRIEPRISYVGILNSRGRLCHICDQPILLTDKLHFDHIVPLSRGGTHTTENIAPAHELCNLSKGRKLLAEL